VRRPRSCRRLPRLIRLTASANWAPNMLAWRLPLIVSTRAEGRSGISKDPESSEERLSVLLAKIIGPGFKTRMELDRPSTPCHDGGLEGSLQQLGEPVTIGWSRARRLQLTQRLSINERIEILRLQKEGHSAYEISRRMGRSWWVSNRHSGHLRREGRRPGIRARLDCR